MKEWEESERQPCSRAETEPKFWRTTFVTKRCHYTSVVSLNWDCCKICLRYLEFLQVQNCCKTTRWSMERERTTTEARYKKSCHKKEEWSTEGSDGEFLGSRPPKSRIQVSDLCWIEHRSEYVPPHTVTISQFFSERFFKKLMLEHSFAWSRLVSKGFLRLKINKIQYLGHFCNP